MTTIFAYTDYRAWLQAWFDARKSERDWFSLRYVAGKLDMDAGQLVKILRGKLQLPLRRLPDLLKLCELEGREATYFEEMVRLSRAKTPAETREHLERMASLRGVSVRDLGSDQSEYFQDWRHAAVRGLAGIFPFRGGLDTVAGLFEPPMDADTLKSSLDLLVRLGLLQRDEKGYWRLSEPHVSPGGEIPVAAVRDFQTQMLNLAERALSEVPKEERDISSLTLTMSWEELGLFREWVADLRRRAQNLAQECARPEVVFQLNIQLFPLARARRRS